MFKITFGEQECSKLVVMVSVLLIATNINPMHLEDDLSESKKKELEEVLLYGRGSDLSRAGDSGDGNAEISRDAQAGVFNDSEDDGVVPVGMMRAALKVQRRQIARNTFWLTCPTTTAVTIFGTSVVWLLLLLGVRGGSLYFEISDSGCVLF